MCEAVLLPLWSCSCVRFCFLSYYCSNRHGAALGILLQGTVSAWAEWCTSSLSRCCDEHAAPGNSTDKKNPCERLNENQENGNGRTVRDACGERLESGECMCVLE